MDSDDEIEKECKRIINKNKVLYRDFQSWLINKNLSVKVIEKHCSNIDIYINEFLVWDRQTEAEDGSSDIGQFLGYWFIRSASWASKSTIKENATSIKKFYQFMFENKKISKESLDELKHIIKVGIPDWVGILERYYDLDIKDMNEVWGFQ